MPFYYKNCISFLILILISLTKGFSDVARICPEEFVDGQENIVTCIVNYSTIAARCLKTLTLLFDFRPTPTSLSRTLCSTQSPPFCSGTLSKGFKSSSCGCINQSESGDVYTYQFSFQTNKSEHLNGDIRCVPCYGWDKLIKTETGSCTTMKFKTNGIDAPTVKGIAPTGPELSTWRTVIIFINTILSLLSSF